MHCLKMRFSLWKMGVVFIWEKLLLMKLWIYPAMELTGEKRDFGRQCWDQGLASPFPLPILPSRGSFWLLSVSAPGAGRMFTFPPYGTEKSDFCPQGETITGVSPQLEICITKVQNRGEMGNSSEGKQHNLICFSSSQRHLMPGNVWGILVSAIPVCAHPIDGMSCGGTRWVSLSTGEGKQSFLHIRG